MNKKPHRGWCKPGTQPEAFCQLPAGRLRFRLKRVIELGLRPVLVLDPKDCRLRMGAAVSPPREPRRDAIEFTRVL